MLRFSCIRNEEKKKENRKKRNIIEKVLSSSAFKVSEIDFVIAIQIKENILSVDYEMQTNKERKKKINVHLKCT